MSELVKPFLIKKSGKIKKSENQCQNAECEQKTHYREMEIWFQQKN